MTGKPTTAAVWSQLSADLRRYLRRRVADEHQADDLLQETFVRIHRHIDTLTSADRVAAWVFQIARRVLIDHYRQQAGAAPPLADFEPAGTDDRQSQLRFRAGLWLEELVGQLDEPYREAVRLAEIEGLPQKEVARRLGLSLSGAKSRIQRGRVLLKKVLERCCTWGV